MWYAIYKIDTGELCSIGSVVADVLPVGMASVDLGADKPDLEALEWNVQSKSFSPKVVTEKIITREEFIDRFTNEEFENILELSISNKSIAGLVKKLDYKGSVNLASEKTIAGINALEAAGILAVGRAAVVLA